jgi:hypothetical protein
MISSCIHAQQTEGALNKQEQAILIDRHNYFRMTALPFQAGNMMRILWSEELANEAAVEAKTCSASSRAGINAHIQPDDGNTIAKLIDRSFQEWVIDTAFQSIKSLKAPSKHGDAIGTNVYNSYSQVVWAETKEVGCALASCDNGLKKAFVCKYGPAGNTPGAPWYVHDIQCNSCPEGTLCKVGLCVAPDAPQANDADIPAGEHTHEVFSDFIPKMVGILKGSEASSNTSASPSLPPTTEPPVIDSTTITPTPSTNADSTTTAPTSPTNAPPSQVPAQVPAIMDTSAPPSTVDTNPFTDSTTTAPTPPTNATSSQVPAQVPPITDTSLPPSTAVSSTTLAPLSTKPVAINTTGKASLGSSVSTGSSTKVPGNSTLGSNASTGTSTKAPGNSTTPSNTTPKPTSASVPSSTSNSSTSPSAETIAPEIAAEASAAPNTSDAGSAPIGNVTTIPSAGGGAANSKASQDETFSVSATGVAGLALLGVVMIICIAVYVSYQRNQRRQQDIMENGGMFI